MKTVNLAAASVFSDGESRRVSLTFLRPDPIPMGLGFNLAFDPAGADFSRVSENLVPLLAEHDRTRVIGMVESAGVGVDGVSLAEARFNASSDANRILGEMRDGQRPRGVSAGLLPLAFDGEWNEEDDEFTLTATRWRLDEISSVSVPAVQGVGFNLSAEAMDAYRAKAMEMRKDMADKTQTVELGANAPAFDKTAAELEELKTIAVIGETTDSERVKKLASSAIAEGKTLAEFRAELQSQTFADRPFTKKVGAAMGDRPDTFNLTALAAAVGNKRNAAAQDRAAIEFGFASEWQNQHPKLAAQHGGTLVPIHAALGGSPSISRPSDVELAIASIAAGNSYSTAVPREVMEFQMPLVTMSPVLSRCFVETGLMGETVRYPVLVPATGDTPGVNPAFEADTNATRTDRTPTMRTVDLEPHQAITSYSMTSLAQIQNLNLYDGLRRYANQTLSRGVERAVVAGSGASNQPLGLLSIPAATRTGVNVVEGPSAATNAATAAQVSYTQFYSLLEELVSDGVPINGRMLFLVRAAEFVRGLTEFIDSPGSGVKKITMPESDMMMARWSNEVTEYTGMLDGGFAVGVSPDMKTTGFAAGDALCLFAQFEYVLAAFWSSLEVVDDFITTPGQTTVSILLWMDTHIMHDEALARLNWKA